MYRLLVLVAMMLLLGAQTLMAAPKPWFLSEGGNGHYYELVVPRRGITWTAARDAAEEASFLGVNGHLVTITSSEEWQFVTQNFEHQGTWIGLTDRIVEGRFEWVTGEPVTFRAWNRHEPNNAGNEDYVEYHLEDEGWGWNDFQDKRDLHTADLPLGYVIEYPLPRPIGDFNDDNVLNALDVDQLTTQTLSGGYNPRFDLSADGAIDDEDRKAWVELARATYFGDSNLDGEFNSSDMVNVFAAGQYEDDELLNSTWETGDWNGDFEFSTLDFLVAFQSGGYERGPRGAVRAVPEPTSLLMTLAGIGAIATVSRTRRKGS